MSAATCSRRVVPSSEGRNSGEVGTSTVVVPEPGRLKVPFGYAMPLGDSSRVDEIRVRWPSGREQVVPGPIDANQQILVTEPEA